MISYELIYGIQVHSHTFNVFLIFHSRLFSLQLHFTPMKFWSFNFAYNISPTIRGGSRILRKKDGRKFFLEIHASMWRLVEDVLCYWRFQCFFKFEILVLILFALILFENTCNHQSSWWSTCLILVFCNQAKNPKATNKKRGTRVRCASALNLPLMIKLLNFGTNNEHWLSRLGGPLFYKNWQYYIFWACTDDPLCKARSMINNFGELPYWIMIYTKASYILGDASS